MGFDTGQLFAVINPGLLALFSSNIDVSLALHASKYYISYECYSRALLHVLWSQIMRSEYMLIEKTRRLSFSTSISL